MNEWQDNDAEPPRYIVQESERAESDQSAIFLRLTPLLGPERANDIFQGMTRVIAKLADFPGPKSNAIDESATEVFGITVRRAFYYGPAARRISVPYRILYTIIEPRTDHDIGIIRVLRVLHGSEDLNPAKD